MEIRNYCDKCKLEFNKEIKSMNDLKKTNCPKCGKECTGKKAPNNISKTEENIGKIAYFLINFYFYFYLIFSIISYVFYYLGLNKLFLISFILMISLYIIELLMGYTRNIFGFVGIAIGGIIGYLFDNVLLGITYVFLISSIIKVLINLIINVIIRRCK